MKHLISFFCKRHLLVNLITAVVFIGGVVAWNITNKEELPDITFNSVRISTSYSGASAQDVEFYVTKPIEEAIQGIDGIYRLTSSSSSGQSSIRVELEQSIKDIDKIVTEIQSQVSSVQLPEDIINEPRVRVFETSKKAIIDIAIYDESKNILDVQSRINLQNLARGLETKLLAQPEVFEVNRSGYLVEEVNVNVDPKKVALYEIPLTDIAQEIQRNNVRSPAGTIKSGRNEQVTVLAELDTKKKLDNVVVQGGFDSKLIKLNKIAHITDSFEDQTSISKVNGREAIMFNVVKNSRFGILDALEKVRAVTNQYEKTVLSKTTVKVTFLDDESIDVRNRLNIVTTNGLMGFILIVGILFIFLNKRSGFWVALGIPFTLCFTLLSGYFMGYTINGITLAGIIIVLGIVVDDAIIIAENISRKINEGVPLQQAAIDGTNEVISPIIASILTTCVAFVPLFFFSGRFGNFVKFIPPIIFLMLLASLLESFFLLPSHMTLFPKKFNNQTSPGKLWFNAWENTYERVLNFLLPKRYWILLFFIVLMIASTFLVTSKFKFVMFPEEESREIVITGIATKAISATETSNIIQPLEEFLRTYLGKEGIGIRTQVARGRRGDAAVENQFSITVEIQPVDKRKKSTDQLLKEIQQFADTKKNLSKVRFRKNRFGQSSGSVFEIVIQENDDVKRDLLVKKVMESLKKHPNIINIEEDIIPSKPEYIIQYNQEKLKRLSVNPANIATTLRTVLNGRRLYTLFRNDEEIEVKLTVDEDYRKNIDKILSIPISNNQNYLIPLNNLVTVKKVDAKNSIRRHNMKRSSFVYADIKAKSKQSPLEVAEEFENTIFPEVLADFPTSQISFEGEVMDTRESKQDLMVSIIIVISLIYLVLAILFDSLIKPLRIMLVIPFGIIGVVFAFYLHGKVLFGFYAAIGTLGMLGVVVNDAIVMLSKLDSKGDDMTDVVKFTSNGAKTRLRAIILTTLTTVVGVMPTAYGIGGTDTMLSDMMIALAWGLLFGTLVTLVLTPCFFLFEIDFRKSLNLLFKKLSKALPLVVFCLILTTPIYASDTKLSLQEFISLATKNDTKFHSILIDNLKLHYLHDLNVDPSELFFSAVSGFNLDAGSLSNDTSLSLTQTLPDKGQSMGASFAYDGDSSDSSFSFTFSQDIARNAFGKAIKLDSSIQGIKTEINKFQIIEAYEDYMAELMNLYYTWLRQYESFQLSKSSYKDNDKVLKSILSRQKQKIADETDVNKLNLQTLAKQEQVIKFEQNYLQTTAQILRITHLDPNTSIFPDATINLDTVTDNLTTVLTDLKLNSRTFVILNLIRKRSIFEVDRIAQSLLPSIQLSASLAQTSDTTAKIGASFGLPLKNSSTKASYETAKITSKQTQLNTDSTVSNLTTTISNLHLALRTQKKLIETATKKRELASNILKNESVNYSYGRITLNDYISAVNRFDTTRFDEIDQKITFQQLSIEWKRITDSLVTKPETNEH